MTTADFNGSRHIIQSAILELERRLPKDPLSTFKFADSGNVRRGCTECHAESRSHDDTAVSVTDSLTLVTTYMSVIKDKPSIVYKGIT
jgi:hypothetical protein